MAAFGKAYLFHLKIITHLFFFTPHVFYLIYFVGLYFSGSVCCCANFLLVIIVRLPIITNENSVSLFKIGIHVFCKLQLTQSCKN